MDPLLDTVTNNIKRFRELKNLSQKEVSAASNIPQGQYSRMENGKVEPTISSLQKLSLVFEVHISEFFKSFADDTLDLPFMDKMKLMDTLEDDEKNALLKIIDMAISKKKMKDHVSQLLNS